MACWSSLCESSQLLAAQVPQQLAAASFRPLLETDRHHATLREVNERLSAAAEDIADQSAEIRIVANDQHVPIPAAQSMQDLARRSAGRQRIDDARWGPQPPRYRFGRLASPDQRTCQDGV